VRFENKNIFFYLKNALAYNNAGEWEYIHCTWVVPKYHTVMYISGAFGVYVHTYVGRFVLSAL
jgi:hypothetical protein